MIKFNNSKRLDKRLERENNKETYLWNREVAKTLLLELSLSEIKALEVKKEKIYSPLKLCQLNSVEVDLVQEGILEKLQMRLRKTG